MRAALAATGLALAASLVALAVVEGVLRLVGWQPPPLRSGWMLTSRAVRLDPDLIVIRRHIVDPAFVAPPEHRLVLAIGDSFTEGYPVAPERAYPPVLGRLLARRGVAVTIRNAGMGDTGPDQHLRLLERLLERLHPTVVIWQLYANDVWDNLLKSTYDLDAETLVPRSAADHWITRRQRFFDWTPLPRGLKKRSLVMKALLHAFEPKHWLPGRDPVEWSLAKMRLEIDALERLAVLHGFVPYVLLVAPQARYLDAADPEVRAGAWTRVDDARMRTLLAGRPEVIDGFLGAAHGADYFATADRDQTSYGDRHLNEHGYARLAALVAHRLTHDGIVARLARGEHLVRPYYRSAPEQLLHALRIPHVLRGEPEMPHLAGRACDFVEVQ